MQGRGAGGAGRGRHGREQVGGVRAPVARQQGHLVVVLGRGQTRVRGCRGRTIASARRRPEIVKGTDKEARMPVGGRRGGGG